MRVWTVHVPRGAAEAPARAGSVPAMPAGAGQPDRRPRPPILVPEGFAWLGFFFTLPWLLWHRLWLTALGYLVLAVALGLALPSGADLFAEIAMQFLLAAHAQDLRRQWLARRGFVLAGVVAAPDRDHALLRLFQARPDLAGTMARAALA